MLHSSPDTTTRVEDERVEKFVMFVIDEATGASSPCPSSEDQSIRLSHTSQEVIEEALGSLANLIISTNSITTIIKRKEKKEKKRENLLQRKKSSLKSLTPEDLGRVLKTAKYATRFINSGDYGNDHLSQYHLRKPISTDIIGGDDRSARSCGKVEDDKNDVDSEVENNLSDGEERERNLCCHGHVCIHHHYHNHHHHYYQSLSDEEDNCDSEEVKVGGGEGTSENICGKTGAEKDEEKCPGAPASAKPQKSLEEIAFYRKFSATSPITTRPKSSLWKNSSLNVLTLWSKSKKKKSRSTPIKLDVISERLSLDGRNRSCGGCVYCSKNEFSCGCCCDECCCARQFSRVAEDDMGTSSRNGMVETLSPRNRSRSVDSLNTRFKMEEDFFAQDEIEIDDEILNDITFIDNQLLRHFHLSDSEENDDGDETIEKIGKNNPISSDNILEDDNVVENVENFMEGNEKNASIPQEIGAAGDTDKPDRIESNGSRKEGIDKSVNVSISKKKRSGRGTLRIANGEIGEIRSSPSEMRAVTTIPTENFSNSSPIIYRRSATSAVMTVTVDTMSLFLDAVHVQMSQE